MVLLCKSHLKGAEQAGHHYGNVWCPAPAGECRVGVRGGGGGSAESVLVVFQHHVVAKKKNLQCIRCLSLDAAYFVTEQSFSFHVMHASFVCIHTTTYTQNNF